MRWVGDAQLPEMVQPPVDAAQRAGKPIGVGDIPEHPLVLVPGRVDLPAEIGVAQFG